MGDGVTLMPTTTAAVHTIRPEPLGDGEHHLPVRHRREQRGVQPLRPDRQPLGVTAGAEVPALAREREQVFVRAGVTANTREPVVEDAAGEELVRDLRDDGPPGAVLAGEAVVVDRLQAMQLIGHQPKERRRLRPSGFVDATRRRGRVGHVRSGTEERPAYARHGCRPPPFRRARGRFDATSMRRRPNDACCRRALGRPTRLWCRASSACTSGVRPTYALDTMREGPRWRRDTVPVPSHDACACRMRD